MHHSNFCGVKTKKQTRSGVVVVAVFFFSKRVGIVVDDARFCFGLKEVVREGLHLFKSRFVCRSREITQKIRHVETKKGRTVVLFAMADSPCYLIEKLSKCILVHQDHSTVNIIKSA